MKIITNDYLDKAICELVPKTIDILLFKIDSKELDEEDYDMINKHLHFF